MRLPSKLAKYGNYNESAAVNYPFNIIYQFVDISCKVPINDEKAWMIDAVIKKTDMNNNK